MICSTIFHSGGKGTDVASPQNWAIGWNSQICGNSTVKWLSRTNLAQSHCSRTEGILFCWWTVRVFFENIRRSSLAYTLNLVTAKDAHGVHEDPGQGATKVDEFVHDKGHDAGCQHIVLHPGIVGGPEPLGDGELRVVLGDVVELTPEGHGRRRQERSGIPGGGTSGLVSSDVVNEW